MHDHELTIKQALVRYKKAVGWALALSICLIMDGYDVSLIHILLHVRSSAHTMLGSRHHLFLRPNPIPSPIW